MRQALRMRPDRLVVGEVRGPEVVHLLAALNTGHEGGCGTVHANAAADVPARLEALGTAAGLDRAALHSQLAAAHRWSCTWYGTGPDDAGSPRCTYWSATRRGWCGRFRRCGGERRPSWPSAGGSWLRELLRGDRLDMRAVGREAYR